MAAITNGELELIADIALEALIEETVPLDSMSTNFTTEMRAVSEVVKVPVYPAADAAAAFNASTNNYEDASADSIVFKDVTLSNRIKSTLSITDTQRPKVLLPQLVRNHIQAAVKQSQIIIMNSILAASFTDALSSTAANFDSDDIADLWAVAEAANYGQDRYMVLGSTYIANLLKDNDLKNVDASGSDRVLRQAEIGTINGFKVLHNKYIPNNSEALVGWITDKSGLAVATGMIIPQDENVVQYQMIQDPNSGFALMQRAHYAPATGTLFITWETLFGVAVGQTAGLDRITSS